MNLLKQKFQKFFKQYEEKKKELEHKLQHNSTTLNRECIYSNVKY